MTKGVDDRIQNFVLVATMRNEGPFVLEWLAYHRSIGFDEVVVCSNGCVDGTPDLLDLLAARGRLTHLPCTPGPGDKPQLFAYAAAQAYLGPRPDDWLMVLDADEFLNIHVGAGGVRDLVAARPDATAFLVNWRVFGSSGHAAWSDEPVTRRFVRAAPRYNAVNTSFKTLFTRADAYHCPLLPHGPGFARAERLAEIRPLDGGGQPLPDVFARSESFLQSAAGTVDWSLAQVNHYNTRSREDYRVKHDRGGGLSPERWDLDWNWRAFDTNDQVDRTIGRHASALEAALAELLADAEIAHQHRRCQDAYRRHATALAR